MLVTRTWDELWSFADNFKILSIEEELSSYVAFFFSKIVTIPFSYCLFSTFNDAFSVSEDTWGFF